MKSLKKKIAAIAATVMMATSALSMSASAWEQDNWSAYYVPYTGSFYADYTNVNVQGLKWTSDQISQMKAARPDKTVSLEFEFRPNRLEADPDYEFGPHDIWDSAGKLTSNIPYAYGEFQSYDPDDVSIAIPDITVLKAGQSYYAKLPMTSHLGAPVRFAYTFETEIGFYADAFNESWPLRGAQYPYTAYLGSTCSW